MGVLQGLHQRPARSVNVAARLLNPSYAYREQLLPCIAAPVHH